jgi:hypothetical protein
MTDNACAAAACDRLIASQFGRLFPILARRSVGGRTYGLRNIVLGSFMSRRGFITGLLPMRG